MAALDFPAAPVLNQTFGASNGVTYQWTGQLWRAVGVISPDPGGDFHATGLIATGINNSSAVVAVFPTVLVGNAGGWYNTTNGRFTPPAGRYKLSAGLTFYSSSAATSMYIGFRKNGVSITGAANISSSPTLNHRGEVDADVVVDANGTDYFDAIVQSGVGGGPTPSAVEYSWFNAFPLSGIKGPPGDQGPAPSGDFMAGIGFITPALSSTPQKVTPTGIISGNSGGWYSTSTGRFTPPAGRYFISVCLFGASDTAADLSAIIYKNGAEYARSGNTTAAASYQGAPICEVLADANGTDYFEFYCRGNAGTSAGGRFLAYPITGIKGPPGDQLNGFRLLQRTQIGAAVPDVKIQNIPADINDLMFTFDLSPSLNGQDLVLQYYNDVGALVSAAASYTSSADGTNHVIATGAASFAVGSATVGTTNAILMTYSVATRRVHVNGIRGRGTIPNIRAAGREKTTFFQVEYVSDDAAIVLNMNGSGRWGTAPMVVSGFRLLFGSGNIASGSFSVWGSP